MGNSRRGRLQSSSAALCPHQQAQILSSPASLSKFVTCSSEKWRGWRGRPLGQTASGSCADHVWYEMRLGVPGEPSGLQASDFGKDNGFATDGFCKSPHAAHAGCLAVSSLLRKANRAPERSHEPTAEPYPNKSGYGLPRRRRDDTVCGRALCVLLPLFFLLFFFIALPKRAGLHSMRLPAPPCGRGEDR